MAAASSSSSQLDHDQRMKECVVAVLNALRSGSADTRIGAIVRNFPELLLGLERPCHSSPAIEKAAQALHQAYSHTLTDLLVRYYVAHEAELSAQHYLNSSSNVEAFSQRTLYSRFEIVLQHVVDSQDPNNVPLLNQILAMVVGSRHILVALEQAINNLQREREGQARKAHNIHMQQQQAAGNITGDVGAGASVMRDVGAGASVIGRDGDVVGGNKAGRDHSSITITKYQLYLMLSFATVTASAAAYVLTVGGFKLPKWAGGK